MAAGFFQSESEEINITDSRVRVLENLLEVFNTNKEKDLAYWNFWKEESRSNGMPLYIRSLISRLNRSMKEVSHSAKLSLEKSTLRGPQLLKKTTSHASLHSYQVSKHTNFHCFRLNSGPSEVRDRQDLGSVACRQYSWQGSSGPDLRDEISDS